jgi:hypothetical protein
MNAPFESRVRQTSRLRVKPAAEKENYKVLALSFRINI